MVEKAVIPLKTDELTRWADAGLFPSAGAMRDHLLIGLLQEGAEIPPDYPERLEQAEISFPGSWFGLIELKVIAVDPYAYIRGLGHTAYSDAHLAVNISELLQRRLSGCRSLYVFKIQSEIMCILCGETREDAARLQHSVCEQMLALEQEIDGIRLLAACSDVLEGYDGLKEEKQQVRQIFEYRALHPGLPRTVSFQEMLGQLGHGEDRTVIEKEHAVMSAFKTGHYRQSLELLGALFDEEYLSFSDPLILLKHKCAQYIFGLVSAAREMCRDPLTAELDRLQPERRLMAATNYAEVRAQMEHIFGQLNDLTLSRQKDEAGAEWIASVKDFIRENYTDPDLNVNKLADVFGRNPSYLSRRFLRVTGQSILDYIHRYRIQEAKIRIGQGASLAAVAEQVGYSNALTMSRAFKKYEGTTPGKLKNG